VLKYKISTLVSYFKLSIIDSMIVIKSKALEIAILPRLLHLYKISALYHTI